MNFGLPQCATAVLDRRLFLLGGLAVSACAVSNVTGGAPLTPEEELAQRSRDLQRSMLEASIAGILGAGGVYVLAGPRGGGAAVGVIGAVPIVFATGTYLGYLQRQYRTNEERRERLRRDIALTNAEVEATTRTLNAVTRRHESSVAAAQTSASAEEQRAAAQAEQEIAAYAVMATKGAIDRVVEVKETIEGVGTSPAVEIAEAQLEQSVIELNRAASPWLNPTR